jgi:hypothetical protein
MGDTRLAPSGASQASCNEAESAPICKKASTLHDVRRECFILQQHANVVHCTNFDESSAEGEPTSADASISKEPPQDEGDRERQRACIDKLDEAHKALQDKQMMLHHALGTEAMATPTRKRTQEVLCSIISDVHGIPISKWASQNLIAAAVLLWVVPSRRP